MVHLADSIFFHGWCDHQLFWKEKKKKVTAANSGRSHCQLPRLTKGSITCLGGQECKASTWKPESHLLSM